MKSAKIYMYDRYAGRLTEDENGFQFVYDSEYLAAEGAEPISLTMPLRKEPYESAYFGLEELPILAKEKNNEEQIKMCFSAYSDKNWQVLFD